MDKTRKNNNAARRRTAIFTANARTKARFGRLGQTRVANLFKPEEGPHNVVARAQLNNRKEELAKLESIVEKSDGASSTLKTLQTKLSESIASAKKSGATKINIELPIEFASKLLRALTFVVGILTFIAYWGVNLFVGFFSAGTVMLGDTPKGILNMITGNLSDDYNDYND